MWKYIIPILLALTGTANAQFAGITPCSAKSLSVTSSTGNVALSACGPTAILYNTTSQEAYYNIGSSTTITAVVATSFYIPASSYVVLQVPAGTVWTLAGITPTGTTTFKVVQGTAKP